MGPSDLVTGVQGGVNVNFTQAQILKGQNGTNSLPNGIELHLSAGNGYNEPSVGGQGAYALMGGGSGYGEGGNLGVYGGSGADSAGFVALTAGNALSGNANGGHLQLNAGAGQGSGNGGGLSMSLGAGGGSGGADGIWSIDEATSSPGSSVGTLLNAPSAGNPNVWLAVTINGTARFIPAW